MEVPLGDVSSKDVLCAPVTMPSPNDYIKQEAGVLEAYGITVSLRIFCLCFDRIKSSAEKWSKHNATNFDGFQGFLVVIVH